MGATCRVHAYTHITACATTVGLAPSIPFVPAAPMSSTVAATHRCAPLQFTPSVHLFLAHAISAARMPTVSTTQAVATATRCRRFALQQATEALANAPHIKAWLLHAVLPLVLPHSCRLPRALHPHQEARAKTLVIFHRTRVPPSRMPATTLKLWASSYSSTPLSSALC